MTQGKWEMMEGDGGVGVYPMGTLWSGGIWAFVGYLINAAEFHLTHGSESSMGIGRGVG
jgi:hypothetical protein